MGNIKIENLLLEIEQRINELKTPEIRARALFDYLKKEQDGFNIEDLLASVRHGINKTLEIMDHWEIIEELNYALRYLTAIIENNHRPGFKFHGKLISRYEDLKLRLNAIVLKYEEVL